MYILAPQTHFKVKVKLFHWQDNTGGEAMVQEIALQRVCHITGHFSEFLYDM